MKSTKRKFMIAGGILGIIFSALSLINQLTTDIASLVRGDYLTTEVIGLTGTYLFQMPTLIISLVSESLLYVAVLVLSIIVITMSSKKIIKKGPIIALLVMSVLTGNLICMAFMIVVLCLKDKVKTESNQDDNNNENVKNTNNDNETKLTDNN